MRHKDRSIALKGVSLLECLITLTIITILFQLCQVDLSPFWQRLTIYQQTSRLFEVLQFARTEAIQRQRTVNVCGSSNGHQCTTDWTAGYIVFLETNQKYEILREEPSTTIPIHSGHLAKIQFASDGRCLTRGTLYLGKAHSLQKIVIYDSGRVRIESSSTQL